MDRNEQIADHFARTCGTTYPALYEAFLEVCRLKDLEKLQPLQSITLPWNKTYSTTSTLNTIINDNKK